MRIVVLLGKLVIFEHLLIKGRRWREHKVLVPTMLVMMLVLVHYLIIHGSCFGQIERALLVSVIFGKILLHAAPSIN